MCSKNVFCRCSSPFHTLEFCIFYSAIIYFKLPVINYKVSIENGQYLKHWNVTKLWHGMRLFRLFFFFSKKHARFVGTNVN